MFLFLFFFLLLDEPLCYKNQILDQLLNDIDFSTPSHIAVFQVADDLLTDVVDSILRIYFKLCDFSLQTLVAQGECVLKTQIFEIRHAC